MKNEILTIKSEKDLKKQSLKLSKEINIDKEDMEKMLIAIGEITNSISEGAVELINRGIEQTQTESKEESIKIKNLLLPTIIVTVTTTLIKQLKKDYPKENIKQILELIQKEINR